MARRQEETDYGFPPARGGRGAPSMFPRKLFQILCETDPAVVEWDSDGESFHIADMEQFVESVMPLYYRHKKLTSFQRQLNLYGFKKRGRDEKHAGHYYHPFFQRDRPDILGDVRRSYPTGSGNSKSEDDEGDSSSGNSTPHPRAAFSRGMSLSPGRPRTGSNPKRKAEASTTLNLNKKSPPPPLPSQQHQNQERIRPARTGSGSEARGSDGGGRYPPPYAYRSEFVGRGLGGENDNNEAPVLRKNAQRTWPYPGSSVFTEAAMASRHKRSEHQRYAEGRMRLDGDEVWINSGGGHGGMGGGAGAGGRAAYMRSNARDEMPGRHPYYPATNGRIWGAYREPEESGGAMWYDSEGTGFSKLPPGESPCSTWCDMHTSHGGSEFYDRSRSRAMAASPSTRAMGGTDPRRINYPPGGSGSGGGGRPLGGHPVHRGVPTSTVFPAHYLRQERFGAYPDPHYPPPPVFLPAHTTPDPDVLPTRKSSKWRPVYDESRLGAGGDIVDGGRMGGSGSSWSDPSRYARDGSLAADRDDRNAMLEGRAVSSAAHDRSREGACVKAAPRPQTGHDSQGPSGSGSSSYRAACEDFLRADEDTSESVKANGSRFDRSDTRPVASSPASKGDTVSTRAIAMTATS